MKLRIRGNSVRIRVTRSELDGLVATGSAADSVRFGPDSGLSYRLVTAADGGGISARFSGSELTVTLPAPVVADWAATDRVSIEAAQDLGHGESLGILVEKDFECMVPRADEPPGDFFANPARRGT